MGLNNLFRFFGGNHHDEHYNHQNKHHGSHHGYNKYYEDRNYQEVREQYNYGQKRCHKCSAKISEESKFCSNCGTEINHDIFCKECGEKLSSNSSFCSNCGKNV
ncbi:zinc ribbon domain-containing protein [Clostridium sp. UBA1652]|uniref:zinc ribbon domain-containing protein n=1 Tax=Clostridium sp. UBA1652 TaxID=1946348 RepID=UPI00257FE378|nr:zinc ribbon domain-containing protein [Clostridium sp. UBA1652]